MQVGDVVVVTCDPYRPAEGMVLRIEDTHAIVMLNDGGAVVPIPLTCLEAEGS